MKTNEVIILVLIICVYTGYATRTIRKLQRDNGDSSSHPEEEVGQLPSTLPRDGRKIIFINNVAYDLGEEEMAIYLKEGRVPIEDDKLKRKPNLDTLSAFMNSPEENDAKETSREKTDGNDNNLFNRISEEEELVKTSRFVADPEKVHLIEDVKEDELQKLKASVTTPKPDERVVTEASVGVDTSTVRYEITQVSVLQFLWNEFKNIGDLLGREMLGSLSGTLYYLWESLMKYVTSRSRREIQDASSEL